MIEVLVALRESIILAALVALPAMFKLAIKTNYKAAKK